MFEEEIKRLNPKPKFNLTWYRNEDRYSDGAVENDIIHIIAENNPEDYSDAIYGNFSWPVYYYLINLRKNILNWYPFQENADILEIGCGLGAVTDMLCDRGRSVTAVELSKRRATAALLRCRERENLEIIVGNLNDIKFEKKFDYITLIGVLEYQGHYTESEHPYTDFLSNIRRLLKPNGKLLIAIENKYGLKYWCGASEDHTGVPFDGLNQYRIGNKNACTFSKAELTEVIEKSGFGHHYFYYPLPDYKLPMVIYSEDYLPTEGKTEKFSPYYIPNTDGLVIDETGLYDNLIKNNVFEFFANSFLVECGNEKEKKTYPVFAALSSERKREYRIGTVIDSEKKVSKFVTEASAEAGHIKQIGKNLEHLKKHGLDIVPYSIENGVMKMDYQASETLETIVLRAYKNKNMDEIGRIYDRLWNEIEKSSDIVGEEYNILRDAGKEQDYGKILAYGNLDMILKNCFVSGENWEWFDQEWGISGVPAAFIFFRAVTEAYVWNRWLGEVLPIREVFVKYGIVGWVNDFMELNECFMEEVIDRKGYACSSRIRSVPDGVYVNNISKLV